MAPSTSRYLSLLGLLTFASSISTTHAAIRRRKNTSTKLPTWAEVVVILVPLLIVAITLCFVLYLYKDFYGYKYRYLFQGRKKADKKAVHPILVTAGAAPAGVSQEDTTATAPTTTKNEPKKKKKNQNKASYQKLQAEEKAIDDVELANEFWERAEAPTQTEPPARQDTVISIDSVDTIVVPIPDEK